MKKNCYTRLPIFISLLFLISTGCDSVPEGPSEPATQSNTYVYETTEDPDVPYVRKEWQDWIKANHDPITSLSSDNFEDLEFLSKYIGDKTIVLMGEVAHGIAEQNRIRVRMIKYLHQQFGFNVVAFESGFYDCYITNKDIDHKQPEYSLKSALYTMWNTTDLADLFSYIWQSQKTGSPLNLAGFDIHASGTNCETRPQFFRNILMKIDSTFSDLIYEQDKIIVGWRKDREYVDNYIFMNYESLYLLYGQLINLLDENEDILLQNLMLKQ